MDDAEVRKLNEEFRRQLADLCDVYERATGHTVGLHLLELADGGETSVYDWNGESMYETAGDATPGNMPEIKIPQDLCFAMLQTLRLARIYALMGSKIESELGEDFKPWKFGTESVREFADDASHQYMQLVVQMGNQVRPYPERKEDADEEGNAGVPPDRPA